MIVIELELELRDGIQEVAFPEGAMTIGACFNDDRLNICMVADPVRHIQIRKFLVVVARGLMPYDTLLSYIGSAKNGEDSLNVHVFEVDCPEIDHASFRQREGFNIEWLVIG